jgi:TP901 family phage tail tape measure protein
MSGKHDVAISIIANSAGMRAGLNEARTGIRRFSAQASSDLDSLKRAFGSLQGKLAAIGVAFGTYRIINESAKLDKQLTQVRLTAGATVTDAKKLRGELYALAQETGNSVENLTAGFGSLIASGQTWAQARSTIDGINTAMAVSGANSQTLANGLTVAATAFNFDLSKPGMALELLDKMTVAGRQGNAELENLSDIFGRVGVNASSAGMSFEGTLAFIEALSMVQKSPERLATLADSTLRIFTNLQYMRRVQSTTGIKFFDEKGSQRDAMAVMQDIKARYSAMRSEEAKANFLGTVFKGADLDTIKGLRALLSGDMLNTGEKFARQIERASGTLRRDLGDATDNAIDQAARLKVAMGRVGDAFAKPINRTIANLAEYALKPTEEGGAGMSGGSMIGGAAALGLTSWLVGRTVGRNLPGPLKKLMGGVGSTAAGVAEGKALEAATGVMPVFVTNWSGAQGAFGGIMGGQSGNGLDPNLITFGGAAAAGGKGMAGGILGKILGFAGPAALAGVAAYQAEALISGSVAAMSKGKYANVEEAIYDMFAGGKIGKAFDANKTTVNVTVNTDGRVLAETSSTNGASETKVNTLRRGRLK